VDLKDAHIEIDDTDTEHTQFVGHRQRRRKPRRDFVTSPEIKSYAL
jgi:hypothetical protein